MRRATLFLCLALVAVASLHQASAHASDIHGFQRRMTSSEKTSWPELVGVSKSIAKSTIEVECPDATVYLVPTDSVVTMDYRTDRVRVFYDQTDKVARAPTIG